MEPQRKASKQEPQERRPKENQNSDENQSDVEDEQSQDNQSKDSFIVEDDEIQQSYSDDDYGSKSKKKKKKQKDKDKKEKKKKKKKQKDSDDDSVFADDLQVVDAAQGGLTRLKKNRDKSFKQNQDDDYQEQQEQMEDIGGQRDDDDGGYQRDSFVDQSDQSAYHNRKYQEADLNDLFDENIRRQFFTETTDKQIVDMNLPERQIMKYKTYAKIQDTQIEIVQKQFQSEDRGSQAKWVYERLKQISSFKDHFQIYEEGKIRAQIENVLLAINKQHLQIMYIYYYRKKIWGQTLTLQILMKIQEFDGQWIAFKKQFKALKDDITSVIPSFHQVPRSLQQALNSCTEINQLRAFKDYTTFIMSKRKTDVDTKSVKKNHVVKQICGRSIDVWISQRQIILSPHNLCLNFRSRNQQKKPKTPNYAPNKAFRALLNDEDEDEKKKKEDEKKKEDKVVAQPPQKKQMTKQEQQQLEDIQDRKKNWSQFPLLHPDRRIVTIVDYYAQELFNYPELRKILKQKYYKKLLISTLPTTKGVHYVNIYSQFFPVKRIKDKPVSSLRKQMWILAKEAERMGLITIQLKFEWQLTTAFQKINFDADPVCAELSKYYFDLSTQSSGDSWNLLRRQIVYKMLTDYFFPAFKDQVKQDLTREGTRQVIQSCCQKFRSQLNKGPSLKDKQPIKILAMVLQQQKLGIAFVDEQGKQHSLICIQLRTDDELKRFVGEDLLRKLIEDNNPDMILVAANCRRAQTLRKQLRTPSLFEQVIYVGYGEYQVPSLMANKNIIQGVSSQKCILEAVSMARLKKNPMAQILGLWNDNLDENAVYSMNLHPLQRFINKRKLIDSLEKVAIEIVNMVGVDIDDIRNSDHIRNVLQFVSGLGPRKAFDLIQKVKQKYPPTRKHLLDIVKSQHVYINCSPFIKFQRAQHLQLLQKSKGSRADDYKKQKHSKKSKDTGERSEINLLDTTRIPQEWYALTQRLFLQAIKTSNISELKHKKNSYNLSDQQLAVRQMFKHPQKLTTVQWQQRKDQNKFYDQNLVKTQIMNNFKDPRDVEKVMENRDIFYSLLKQTPDTLKRYMVVTVKILSVSQNKQFLNVVIPQNGLFGFIKLPNDRNNEKKNYEKSNFIKAVITGFPFDERRQRDRQDGDQQIQLLKVDMMLNFPHRSQDKNHDCHRLCFPNILKQIHPNIDLDKQNFDLDKESLPIVEAKQQVLQRPKTQLKRISHPKFKNINMVTAVEQVKELKVGDFIIRPSTQGNNFLTITWHFYKGIAGHIKLKSQQRSQPGSVPTYRVLDKAQDKVYSSIDEIIEKYLKPMNNLVQDVISNKKFLPIPINQIEQKIKLESSPSQQYIQYFFGCSPQYPQFFILVYIYKEKRPIKELIRVKSDGLYFHDQTFHSLRELISFFKEHLKDKKYQTYAKNTALKK